MKNLGRFATVLLVVCLFGVLSCTSEPVEEAPAPIEVGPGTHLFVDDRLVAETDRVWRSLNRPTKHRENPVVKPDRPWEGYLVLQPEP